MGKRKQAVGELIWVTAWKDPWQARLVRPKSESFVIDNQNVEVQYTHNGQYQTVSWDVVQFDDLGSMEISGEDGRQSSSGRRQRQSRRSTTTAALLTSTAVSTGRTTARSSTSPRSSSNRAKKKRKIDVQKDDSGTEDDTHGRGWKHSSRRPAKKNAKVATVKSQENAAKAKTVVGGLGESLKSPRVIIGSNSGKTKFSETPSLVSSEQEKGLTAVSLKNRGNGLSSPALLIFRSTDEEEDIDRTTATTFESVSDGSSDHIQVGIDEIEKEDNKASEKESELSEEDGPEQEPAEETDIDNEEEEDDDISMDPVGQKLQSANYTHYNLRDGLYYKTYLDMVNAKRRLNQEMLQNLGLNKVVADLKKTGVTKKRLLPAKKKRSLESTDNLRRSSRLYVPPPSPMPRRSTRTVVSVKEVAYPNVDPKVARSLGKELDSAEDDDNNKVFGDETSDEEEKDDSFEVYDKRKMIANQRWKLRYQELKLFKREKGHCKVPVCYTKNRELGRWVVTQRKHYRLFTSKKACLITQRRIDKLNKIGFLWRTRAAPVPWPTRYAELKVYYETFGHSSVRMKSRYADCTPLAKWVRCQRFQYRHVKKGNTDQVGLTEERIEKLNQLEFDWDGPYSVY